jgi:murein DD-endopeptidase MepM/ murein hydrolase activator NlpD
MIAFLRVRWRYVLLVILFLGFLLPQQMVMPVEGANTTSYHAKSFWYSPWGKSGVHKGVDIFAKRGVPVLSSTDGIVLWTGEWNRGGNVVLVLGAKWRVHYYAHLNTIDKKMFSFMRAGQRIGTVGDSGNAKGKPPHLHYSIVTLIPYLWRVDNSPQGWKKMFYLNPIEYLSKK